MVILYAWLLADFLSGLFHYLEDRVFKYPSFSRALDSIILDNEVHHKNPVAMLKYTESENINGSVVFAWPLALILFLLGAPTILWLAVFFASFANLVHRFAHTPFKQLNFFIKFMQCTGLFITARHHNKHHYKVRGLVDRKSASVRFCVMTNWLNPLLDTVQFFKFLDYLFLGRKTNA